MAGLLAAPSISLRSFSMTALRQRMLEDMRVRNLSPHTQSYYILQVSLFARHFGRSPEELGPEEIRAWQVHLTDERKLSPASIAVAVSALRFLYKVTLKKAWTLEEVLPAPKPPHKLPVVLSPLEVARFLGCVDDIKHHAILTTCYAAGLRISEAVHLKVGAIDSRRMVIRIDQGKGRKDRYVMLSPALLETLRAYWPTVHAREWLFPGDLPGQPISRDAVGDACRKAQRLSRLTKPVTPHSRGPPGPPRAPPAARRSGCPASPSRSPRIHCVTPLRSICWKPAPTCA